MKKQMISFSNQQHQQLKEMSRHSGVSVSELVRRSVDYHHPDSFNSLKEFMDAVNRACDLDSRFDSSKGAFIGYVRLSKNEMRERKKIAKLLPDS